MALEVKSGASADLWTIDPTSKAGRVTLYDSLGNEVDKQPTGSYIANIGIRHTAADAPASMVWAMHNPVGSAVKLYLRNVRGRVGFDGTAAAAASVGYEFVRFTAADPTTGTTVPRVKKRSTYAASVLADANIQQKSGVLTMTGILNIEVIHVVRLPAAVTNGVISFDFDLAMSNQKYSYMEYEANAGFGIRLHVAAIIGLELSGSVEWDEAA